MKTKIVLFFLFLLTGLSAQQYKNYDWGKPEVYKPDAKDQDFTQITFLDKTIREFVIADKTVYNFDIYHTKIYINSDEAIERNNKIGISVKNNDNEEVVTQKVRVIKPNGTAIDMEKQDVKEMEDQETGIKVKYFALRGLEKGCVIEQLVIKKVVPALSGRNIILQDDYPYKNVSYELIYPDHLGFKTKTYNGVPDFSIDDKVYPGKVSQKLVLDEVPPLKEETYSNFIANVKKFSFKLSDNYNSGKSNLYSYKEYVNSIFPDYTQKLDKKAESKIKDFLKNIKKSDNVEETIFNVEDYVKRNIQYLENYGGETDVLTTLNHKFTNSYGLVRLYFALFNNLGIKNNVVVTSNRYKAPIDAKFENYSNLDELAFYFPDTKKYLAPTETEDRYSYLPYRWMNSYGLFISETEFGGVKMADYDVKFIPLPGIELTHDEMDIRVDFRDNILRPKVNTKITFNGYSAFSLQGLYEVIPVGNIPEFEKNLVENYCGQRENVEIKTENTGVEFFNKKPYIINASFEGTNFVEKAGDKILFKVGQTIGKQVELYQKDKRVMPVEMEYPHAYDRKITIQIPEGYTIKNLEQLNHTYKAMKDGKEGCKFVTDYQMQNNTLVIHNVEIYNDISYPVEEYTDFAKVINAAADFNKLVLVLEKK